MSKKPFPQWQTLEEVTDALQGKARIKDLVTLPHRGQNYSVRSFALGSEDPSAPVFALVGGVHGLEIIGTDVVLAFMQGLAGRLEWDELLKEQLKRSRWVFIPLLNPVGMAIGRRSNGRGIDLMRNAPVEALDKPSFMVGGQRIGKWLPWYRGKLGEPMEPECQAVVEWAKREILPSLHAVVVDVHSGFGLKDRIWHPYAKTAKPFPFFNEIEKLRTHMDQSLPHHVYVFEPQAQVYITHGDLWDYLVDLTPNGNTLLPMTLEMGSWAWVRKNPLQILSFVGPFNPIKPHRKRRILRRHLPFFEFLGRYALSARK